MTSGEKQEKIMNIDPSEIKTPYSKGELEYFKELLIDKREEAKSELEAIHSNLNNLIESDDADFSSIAHHMGDVGSDTEEEELDYQLIERTIKYIRQINEALDRIKDKTYGVCRATGKKISRERLEAVPHTRYSIEAKKKGLADDD